jgi:hypothetical protein
MNKKISFLLLVSFVLIIMCFSGCEELEELNKPNYITVNLQCRANAVIPPNVRLPNVQIEIQIIKDGGERVVEKKTTNGDGYTDYVSASFKLYKEQSIEAFANLLTDTIDSYPNVVFNSAQYILGWNAVKAVYDFGDSTAVQVVDLPIIGEYTS